VIGTPHEATFAQTVAELRYHADLLDLMQCDEHSVLVVHGGGLYGNKTATMQRWVTQFATLPEHVKRRLVLENCEKCFSVEDCLLLSDQVGVPVVFDTHHHECYRATHPDVHLLDPAAYMPRILDTWTKRGIKPKFHISEQAVDGKIGKHSDFIEDIPVYLLDIPRLYKVDIDIMVEAKAKEQAVLKLVHKYKRKQDDKRKLDEKTCCTKRVKVE
jgi:UV DNA damage endonuclease